MSIKNLFDNKVVSMKSAASSSAEVESDKYVLRRAEMEDTFYPLIDFSSASNFARYGSAEEYYGKSLSRVYNEYPYDGSKQEKILFHVSSSYLDRYLFDKRYPKTTGYANLSRGGWGSLDGTHGIRDGYGLSSTTEYIFSRGGLHTGSVNMSSEPLYKTFSNAIIYHTASNRTTNYRMNIPKGITVEFWLQKAAFNAAKTEKEVVLDVWNGKTAASDDYGRFTLTLTGSGNHSDGQNTFLLTLQSGSSGFFEQSIGTSTVTTSSLASWQHYAFTLVSGAYGVDTRFYINGALDEEKSMGSTGLQEIPGLPNAYIGALQTSPSGSTAAQYSGKLSASLDDFRFWKTRRTSKQIHDNYYVHVPGGANKETNNSDLGVYYKFNEGIIGDSNQDSVVLDYSGRIANGTWLGYSAGSRNTGSAFISSSLFTKEEMDPIIYTDHPEVAGLINELQASGSDWDSVNPSLLYNTVPQWMREEDETTGNDNVKYLYQIISSYFDTLYCQIEALPKLKNIHYPSASHQPLPFADKLLEDKGFVVPNLFVDGKILDFYGDRNDKGQTYEKRLQETKNLIYTNIYNNLDYIYKSKGTENSIRNLIRCFGVDDELVKLNMYTDGGTHFFNDNYKQTTVTKKYINFNNLSHFTASIYQTSSYTNLKTYVSGSETELTEKYSAFTTEVDFIVPYKTPVHRPSYFYTPFVSSSIFGMHTAVSAISGGSDVSNYTWAANTSKPNFQVFLLRPEIESNDAKFVLKNRDGGIFLTSSLISNIYDNQHWNLAVKVKPEKYPFQGNAVTSSAHTYKLEFYGVTHKFDDVDEEFLLTASLSFDSGSSFLSEPKRFYLGAQLENFTGSVLQESDMQIGTFRYYFDFLEDSVIRQHNLDPTNYGTRNTFKSPTMFAHNISSPIPTNEALSINWDFNTLTGSDSNGEFIVDDFSSGSQDVIYGWVDNIIRREHRAKGVNFVSSTDSFIEDEYVFSMKKELPESAYTSTTVFIKEKEDELLMSDDDVSDNFYALEKSMYQIVSDEMLNMFSSVKDVSNLFGKAVDRYRTEYKNMNFVRRVFFENITGSLDFDRFTEYFKWIDSSISKAVHQLFPISVRHSEGISDMVESHILERNKYQNKFPLLTRYPSTETSLKSVNEMKYTWKFGHRPIGGSELDNATWHKERAKRIDITDRELVRKVLVNDANKDPVGLAKSDGTIYEGSTYKLNRLSRPYSLSQDVTTTIHGGTNYSQQKNRDFVYRVTHIHGPKTSIGVPKNVMVVGVGEGQGIVETVKSNDVHDPNLKQKYNVKGYLGRYAINPIAGVGNVFAPATDIDSYEYVFDINKLPMNLISASAEMTETGYHKRVSGSYREGVVITNLHSDTFSPTNEIGMQGPFTQRWVGGHQSRHVEINRHDTTLLSSGAVLISPLNNIDDQFTRPEAWRLMLNEYDSPTTPNDGAFGFVGPDFGGPYPDSNRKYAYLYREETAKRPVNIKNIQYTSGSKTYGNFVENYEVISSVGRSANNLHFRKQSDIGNYLPTGTLAALPQTTHPMTLISQAPFVSGNVFGRNHYDVGDDVRALSNLTPDLETLTIEQPVVGRATSGSFEVFGFNHMYFDLTRSPLIAGVSASSHGPYGTVAFKLETSGAALYGPEGGDKSIPGDPSSGIGIYQFTTRSLDLPSSGINRIEGSTLIALQAHVIGGIKHSGSAWNTKYWNAISSSISNAVSGNLSVSYRSIIPSSASCAQNTGSIDNARIAVSSSRGGDITADTFDGKAEKNKHALTSSAFSIAMWIKHTGDKSKPRYLWEHNDGTNNNPLTRAYFQGSNGYLYIYHKTQDNNEFGIYTDAYDWVTETQDHDNTPWTHLAYVFSGSASGTTRDQSLYVNGVQWQTTGSNPHQDPKHRIGVVGNQTRNYASGQTTRLSESCGEGRFYFFGSEDNNTKYSGSMQHVAFFSGTLEPRQVRAIYNSGHLVDVERLAAQDTWPTQLEAPDTGAKLNKLEAYWLFSSGSDVIGYSGSANALGTHMRFYDVADYRAGSSGRNHLSGTYNPSLSNEHRTGSWSFRESECSYTPRAVFNITSSQSSSANNLTMQVIYNAFSSSHISYGTYESQESVHKALLSGSGEDLPNASFVRTPLVNTFVQFGNGVDPITGDERYANDIVNQIDPTFKLGDKRNRTVITSRFSAPGGIEVNTLGYLDVYSREYSVHNALPWRNLTVRKSGSGEANTIRLSDHIGNRDGLQTHLRRHTGKFGHDSDRGSVLETSYVTTPSLFVNPRNIRRRPSSNATGSNGEPTIKETFDNSYIRSTLPQSDFQYGWVTKSLGKNYSVTSGKQRVYGYAPRDGMMSASVAWNGGEKGFSSAIVFPSSSELGGTAKYI